MLLEKIINWVMLAKRLNLGFWKRLLMRSRSAKIPSRLFGFFTSINTNGMPLISSVMSGLNSSSPFWQVSSVTTWKLLLLKFSKSINLVFERSDRRSKKALPKSSLSSSSFTSSNKRPASASSISGLILPIAVLNTSGKILVSRSQLCPFSDRYW